MRIGVPKEVKNHEYRVAITPAGVHELTSRGHDVLIETCAGVGSSIGDDEYLAAGAKIVDDADTAWGEAELVLKVKEPIAEEYHRLREDLTLFTYLHLAASEPCTRALLDAGTTAGLNTTGGTVTNEAVAVAHGLAAVPLTEAIG